jgi:hypothetical protein
LWADSAPAGPPGNVVLRLLASPDGVRFPAPRTLHGVLPGWLATVGPSYLSDTGLAFDRSGMLVVAAVVWRRPAGELITTSVTPRGRVLARQTTVGPEGLVRAMETSPSGRTAALVEDTGIEGESGECVGDGKPRKVWAALREPGARAFSTQLLESRQLICAAVSAHLALARDGRAVVLWGTASETDPPVAPTLRMAEARPGEAFGASSLAPFGPMLGDALFVPSGVLVAATLMPSNLIQPYSGRLSTVTRAIDGTLEPPLTLTSTEVHTTLLAADGRGRLALAWSDGVRVRVSVSEGA